MDKSDFIILIVVGVVISILLFGGIITAIQKSFHSPKPQTQTIDKDAAERAQRKKMEEVRQRQEDLMRAQKQRARDMQR
jgi:hypothetical protein